MREGVAAVGGRKRWGKGVWSHPRGFLVPVAVPACRDEQIARKWQQPQGEGRRSA